MTREQQLETALWTLLDLTDDARLPSGVACAEMLAVRQARELLGVEAVTRITDDGWRDVGEVRFAEG